MSVTYGFYNSLNGDRKYNATQMSAIFDGIIKDGVFMSIGSAMMVTQNNNMVVNVGTGRAWFNHTWTYVDSLYPLTLSVSEQVLNRIDTVVLEIDQTTSTRANTIKIIKGIAATSPKRPNLIKSELINQHALAYIDVKKGVTKITQADITNAVGTLDTPFVTGILETINIDALVLQWGAQFNEWLLFEKAAYAVDWQAWSASQKSSFMTWFNNIVDILDGDTKTNILSILQRHEKGVITVGTVKPTNTNIWFQVI